MRSFCTKVSGYQYMIRPDFELQHLRDIPPPSYDHTHIHYELLFNNNCIDMEYSICGSIYTIKPNDIILISNNTPHQPVFIKQNYIYDRFLLWLKPEFVKSISDEETLLWHCFEDSLLKNNHILHLKESDRAPVRKQLFKLERSYFVTEYGNNILAQLYLAELLVLLTRIYMGFEENTLEIESDTDLINDVLDFISEKLQEDLSLDSIADHFFINKYHLSREFKKYIGLTIHSYIRMQRIRKGENLIKESQLPLSDICHLCGYTDYSSFYRAFTELNGLTPSQYAKKSRLWH